MFDRSFVPNFLHGGSGYVFTMETATKLYNASMGMPLNYLEDSYFTGTLLYVSYVDFFTFSLIIRFLLHLQVFVLRRQTLSQKIQFISTMNIIGKYVC